VSRIRTALGLLLSLALVAVVALFATFLTRDSVLWPLVASRVPSLVQDAVGISFEVDTVGGNVWNGLRLEGVSVEPSADLPAIPTIEGLDVALSYDARALLSGDLEGLRAARVRARRIVVVLGGSQDATSDGGPTYDPWSLADAVPEFFDLLPDGAQIEVDDLHVRTREGAVLGSGVARIRLTPRPRRRVLVTWSDVLSLELLLTRDGLFHVDGSANDPMQRLRSLGVEVPLEGGRVSLSAEGDLGARDLGGSLRWTGADLRERGASAFRAEVRVRSGFAQADAEADLPGVVVRAHDLGVALAEAGSALDAARGSLEVQVSDLEPWRALLPEPALPWLPITARLQASLDGEGLDVRAGAVRARGVEVLIERGRLPLRIEGDVRSARGSVEARVSAPEPIRFDVADTSLQLAGDAVVRVDGTLDEPDVRATLALRDVVAFGHAVAGLDATVRADRATLRIDDAVVRGARPAALQRGLDANLRGALEMVPPYTSIRSALDVSGAWPDLIAHYSPEAAEYASAAADGSELSLDVDLVFPGFEGALPAGRVTAAWSGAEESPSTLRVSADLTDARLGESFEIEVEGSAAPHLVAMLGADTPLAGIGRAVGFNATAHGELDAYSPRDATILLDMHGEGPGEGEPWQVGIAVTLPTPDRVHVHNLEVCGPLHLRSSGAAPLSSDGGGLDLQLQAEVDDARRLSAWIGREMPEATLGLQGSLRGSLGDPTAELALDAASPDLRPILAGSIGLESELPAAIRARLSAVDGTLLLDDVDIDAGAGDEVARLDLRGRAPLRWDAKGVVPTPGLVNGSLEVSSSRIAGAPIAASVPIRWDDRALWLPEIEVRTPLSKIDGQVTIEDPSRILRDVAPADLGVEGSLELWQFDVTRLPASLLPRQVLAGVVDAVLSVEGTVGAPAFAGIVTVSGGRAKVTNDVPTLDAIEARFDLSRDAVEISSLRADVGSGTVTARGKVSSGEAGTLLAAGDALRIDVDLQAREAVFLRGTGKSLRADSDITVTGNPSRIDVAGQVVVLSGTIINRISLVPDFATRGGASVGAGLSLFEIPGPLGDALHFDIAVRTEEPIDVITHVFNAPMSASFSLQGSGTAPFLNGAVSATRGTLRLPAMGLDVRQALITFLPEDPTRPRLLVRADTRRHGVDISLTVTGPADAPEVLLSSLPPLTQQELFVLITTGVLPETLQQQGLSGRATAVGSYLAEEIINFYFGSESTEAGESLADRIHVYSGREISRKGVESIVVDVDIWNGFALEGERDIYQDFNMGVLYRVRF